LMTHKLTSVPISPEGTASVNTGEALCISQTIKTFMYSYHIYVYSSQPRREDVC